MKTALLKSFNRTPVVKARRAQVQVHASVFWSLAPAKSMKTIDQFHQIDLTAAIFGHHACSCASSDYAGAHEVGVDVLVEDLNGLHLVFLSQGTSGDLDSDAALYIIDVDSNTAVKVDGDYLAKGEKKKLHPGALLEFGDKKSYAVLRNVFAHA